MKCKNCNEKIEDENYIKHKNGFVCAICQTEAEPQATIIYSNGDKEIITEFENNTPFKLKYIRSDAWRGYYEVVASKEWTQLHTDNILSMSEDAGELKKFDKILSEFLKSKNIEYAKVYTRSSNLFSVGYDLFVKTKNKNILELIKKTEELKEIFRSEERFIKTALSGASKSDNKEDDILVKCFRKLENGETLEDIKAELEDQINKNGSA